MNDDDFHALATKVVLAQSVYDAIPWPRDAHATGEAAMAVSRLCALQQQLSEAARERVKAEQA